MRAGERLSERTVLESKREKAAALLVFAALLASSARAQQPTTLFKRLAHSVVVVEALAPTGSLVVAIGSGVTVAADRVVTNRHVVDAGTRWRVKQGDQEWRASIIYVDPDHDLALLRAAGLKAPPVSLRLSSTLSVGERVYAIGSPRGLELTLSEGLISGLRGYEDGRLVQTSAAISPGSSGGGLFDEQGRLVGITSLSLADSENLNFALPADWVQALEEAVDSRASSPANQRQATEEFRKLSLHAMTAGLNLETMVQQRRLLIDSTYQQPVRDSGVATLIADGEMACAADAKSLGCFDNWPLWQQAALLMLELREEIQAAQPARDALEASFVDTARSSWSALAGLYCEHRPDGFYTDLDDKIRACANAN